MNKEILIGKKPNIWKLLIKIIITTVTFYIFFLINLTMLKDTKFANENPDFLIGMKWTFIVVYMIILFVLFTGLSLKQYIIIYDSSFCFYGNDGFISQIVDAFLILFHKERKSLIEIPIKEIKKMTLLYNNVETFYYFKGHSIVYCMELKDRSIVKINPDSFDFSNESILKGIEYIKNQGVELDDPYHLIQGLQSQDMKFGDYVDKVVMKNEHHL